MNWILPLETLPGWPEAPDVSGVHMIFLMFLGPLAFGAVIVLIAFTPALSRRFRGELSVDQPPNGEYVALETEAKAQRAAIEPEEGQGATAINEPQTGHGTTAVTP